MWRLEILRGLDTKMLSYRAWSIRQRFAHLIDVMTYLFRSWKTSSWSCQTNIMCLRWFHCFVHSFYNVPDRRHPKMPNIVGTIWCAGGALDPIGIINIYRKISMSTLGMTCTSFDRFGMLPDASHPKRTLTLFNELLHQPGPENEYAVEWLRAVDGSSDT